MLRVTVVSDGEIRELPKFQVVTDDAGIAVGVFKDGKKHDLAFRLDQAQSIPRFYFKSSKANLLAQRSTADHETRLRYGVQSFLHAIIGIEAFSATFFKVRYLFENEDESLNNPDKVSENLSKRLQLLIRECFGREFMDQERVLDTLQSFYSLRNRIVHPKWKRTSVAMGFVSFDGLTEPFLDHFADPELVTEAYDLCLLTVARIGTLAGSDNGSATLFHWAGEYGLEQNQLAERLGMA